MDELWLALASEVVRQDKIHPAGYPATRDGVFAGIQTAIHELHSEHEAMGAWQDEKRHGVWTNTRAELLQAAAVIVRTVRSIDTA